MRKACCAFLFCLCHVIMNGQDTIYKRDGEIISAKVQEINIKEISYRRTDLLEGPLIIVSKNDILRIKYATGQIDSFKVMPIPVQIQGDRIPGKVYTYQESITLSLRRGVYVYKGHQISDSKLFHLATNRNILYNNKEIDYNISASKKNKSLQYALGFGGASVGIVCLYGSVMALSYIGDPGNVFVSMLAASAGTGILISSQFVSMSYKLKRVKHANKVMELYNQSLK